MASSSTAELLTLQSFLALSYVVAMVVGGVLASRFFLPSDAPTKIRRIYAWLAFDAICHFTLEGSFLYHSTFGRTVNTGKDFFAYLWQDYARADYRWGFADETVVSLEILTVIGDGLLAVYCCYLLSRNDPRYHIWAIVLSVAEIYGGAMTFFPEWLTGNKNLNCSTFLFCYVYLYLMNLIWVFIPFYLIYDSVVEVSRSLFLAGSKPLVRGYGAVASSTSAQKGRGKKAQ